MRVRFYRNAAKISLGLSLPLLINCSQIAFDQSSRAAGAKQTQDNGDGTVSGTLNQPGNQITAPSPSAGTTSNPAYTRPPPAVASGTPVGTSGLPRVFFIGPPCTRQTWCEVVFQLDRVYPFTTEFDWRTDDEFYLKPRYPDEDIHAQVNVHYLSGSGHVRFLPGEFAKKIYVRNINPYDYAILINLIMTRCQYGSVAQYCSQLIY